MEQGIKIKFHKLGSNEAIKTISLSSTDTACQAIQKIRERYHLNAQNVYLICHGQILCDSTVLLRVRKSDQDVFEIYEMPNYQIDEDKSVMPKLKQCANVESPFEKLQIFDIPNHAEDEIQKNMFQQENSSTVSNNFNNLLNSLYLSDVVNDSDSFDM